MTVGILFICTGSSDFSSVNCRRADKWKCTVKERSRETHTNHFPVISTNWKVGTLTLLVLFVYQMRNLLLLGCCYFPTRLLLRHSYPFSTAAAFQWNNMFCAWYGFVLFSLWMPWLFSGVLAEESFAGTDEWHKTETRRTSKPFYSISRLLLCIFPVRIISNTTPDDTVAAAAAAPPSRIIMVSCNALHYDQNALMRRRRSRMICLPGSQTTTDSAIPLDSPPGNVRCTQHKYSNSTFRVLQTECAGFIRVLPDSFVLLLLHILILFLGQSSRLASSSNAAAASASAPWIESYLFNDKPGQAYIKWTNTYRKEGSTYRDRGVGSGRQKGTWDIQLCQKATTAAAPCNPRLIPCKLSGVTYHPTRQTNLLQ